jgi:phosphatidylinositol glycan class B
MALTKFRRKPILAFFVAVNILIASYTTQVHQRGVLDVLTFLRTDYESAALSSIPSQHSHSTNEAFVGFLMPCHSTPWRSKLVHPGLNAWALGCEPPIHLAPRTSERDLYRDEADRFYDEPLKFLKTEMNTEERPWPRYIAGFAGIEPILQEYCQKELKGSEMRVKWRGKNSDWHDDSRRVGDVIVWEFVRKDTRI